MSLLSEEDNREVTEHQPCPACCVLYIHVANSSLNDLDSTQQTAIHRPCLLTDYQ